MTVVNQNTLAQVADEASVKADGDIDILAEEKTNATTAATGGAAPEKKEDAQEGEAEEGETEKDPEQTPAEGTEPEEGAVEEGAEEGTEGAGESKKEKKEITVSDILKFLMNLKVEDEDGKEKPAVSKEASEEVAQKLDQAAESATKEDKLEKEEADEEKAADTITITVKDPKDAAVKGVTVVLSGEGKEDVKLTTGEDGTVVFEKVTPGEYTVTVTEGIPENCKASEPMKLTLEEGKGFTGSYTLREKASESQLVGALGIAVGKSSSQVLVNSTGTITAAGKLTIAVDSNVLFDTTADASANNAESKNVGTAIVIQVTESHTMAAVVSGNVQGLL